jgi:radical SAM superfamily enzyme YgiQ (UPF0313 family)
MGHQVKIFLVKPRPPDEVANKASPLPEAYKYAWEPVALKILAYLIQKQFPAAETAVWHIITGEDRGLFLNAVRTQRPDMVAFTELDLLVNEVNSLAGEIKKIDGRVITLAGGKQSSTLRRGDIFPFRNIDTAFRGGPAALLRYIERYLGRAAAAYTDTARTDAAYIAGEIIVEGGRVSGDDSMGERPQLDGPFDHAAMRKINVVNHDMESYIGRWQSHPSILEDPVRTSPCYFGEGCPHNCVFCQSPLEFDHRPARLCAPRETAGEIAWLTEHYGVNNFFSLEANMDLHNLWELYRALDALGIHYAAVSGFIRALDIVKYGPEPLSGLARKGLRVVSIGLDIPADGGADIYHKSFLYADMREALELCRTCGIIVLGTVVGDPGLDRHEFARQLNAVKLLPVADIDIRLAIAIRNTEYYQKNKAALIYDPDTQSEYFDRQNYRCQTIQRPGKIRPEETYALVRDFYRSYYSDENHLSYVREILKNHPDTLPFFKRQYKEKGLPVPSYNS